VSKADKKPYEEQVAKDKKRYEKEMEAYNKDGSAAPTPATKKKKKTKGVGTSDRVLRSSKKT